MENYKIRVENEAESKEAQELFFELGFEWYNPVKSKKEINNYLTIYADHLMTLTRDATRKLGGERAYKEITLPQLRDLVVLKRNDKKDRNVIDPEWSESLYLDSNGHLFVFHLPSKKWKTSNFNGVESVVARLKPIGAVMKEYLNKSTGEYCKTSGNVTGDNWVEIPDGATFYAEDGNLGVKSNYFFRLRSDDFDDEAIYLEGNWLRACFDISNMKVLWQRHADDVPTIKVTIDDLKNKTYSLDDEQTIEIAEGHRLDRIAKENNLRDRYEGETDEDYRYQLQHYLSARKSTVQSTLAERQSTYGSFADVAKTTNALFNMSHNETFTDEQRMAMYMICSKIARLANGDVNHKDSWHDIAGYATLIDSTL